MRSPLRAAEQFERLNEAWTHFTHSVSYYYQIGPFRVGLIFASPILATKITRAFAHLKIDAVSAPDLTIHLWDTATTGQKLPPLDWDIINQNGYHGYYKPPIYLHYFDHINALSALNTNQNKAYYVTRNAAELPWWVEGSPLQIILHAWLRTRGLQLTHTAAIGNNDNAILLTGKGGSGKSTTTLACLSEGLHYLGEDYCILAPGALPQVYSLYQSAKWEAHTRKMFPHYENFIMNPETANNEKALVYYQDLFPTQMKQSLPIRATVSLNIGKRNTPLLQKYDSQQALKNLMMSTLMQLPLYHSDTIRILKEIVADVQHYHLTLGQNVKENVALLQEILSRS